MNCSQCGKLIKDLAFLVTIDDRGQPLFQLLMTYKIPKQMLDFVVCFPNSLECNAKVIEKLKSFIIPTRWVSGT